MIQLERILSATEIQLKKIRKIYENSFPPDERRDFVKLKALLSDSRFTLSAIVFEDEVVGLFSFWDFKHFVYVEHFAVAREFRGNGLGSYVLKSFMDQEKRPVVLEVELPEDPVSFKRINFYKNFGFSVCKEAYIQPPYDKGKQSVPMLIMISNEAAAALPFSMIEKNLHQEVYGFFG
jgi:ribosomal protein S18 acetylase RimI-like enzyme